MSERKVLNKYFPPNFDPSKVPRRKKALDVKDKRHKVRLMAPFSMQCAACHEYIYKGTKFNAIKETVKGEDYIGLKIFRFYIRCGTCHNEITFKTDPQHTDYVAEHGCYRNFNHKRDLLDISLQLQDEQAKDEELNPLLALQNKTEQSKREMLIMDHLDELKAKSRRMDSLANDHLHHDQGAIANNQEDILLSSEDDDLDQQARNAFLNCTPGQANALISIQLAALDEEDSEALPYKRTFDDLQTDKVNDDVSTTESNNWLNVRTKRPSPSGTLTEASLVKVTKETVVIPSCSSQQPSKPPVLGLVSYDSNDESSD